MLFYKFVAPEPFNLLTRNKITHVTNFLLLEKIGLERLKLNPEVIGQTKQNDIRELQEFTRANADKITQLNLSGLSFEAISLAVPNLPSNMESVESIDFRKWKLPIDFNDSRSREEISELLISICKKCPNLKHIYLPDPLIGDKEITYYQLVPTPSTYLEMAKLCPNLQFDQIIILDSKGLPNKDILEELKDHLKEVRIINYFGITAGPRTLERLAKQCPKLQELHLFITLNAASDVDVTEDGIQQIMQNCHQLQTLDLSGIYEIRDSFFENLSIPANLNKLHLHIKKYGDHAHTFFLKAMPQLQELDLEGIGKNPSINQQALKELLELNDACAISVELTREDAQLINNSLTNIKFKLAPFYPVYSSKYLFSKPKSIKLNKKPELEDIEQRVAQLSSGFAQLGNRIHALKEEINGLSNSEHQE